MSKRVVRIEKQCEICKTVMYITIAKSKRRFCNRYCQNVYFKTSGIFSGKNNPSYGKIYRSKQTHPEWAEQISKTNISRGVNIGNKNGMKNPDVAAKMAKTRRERITSNPTYRAERSMSMRKAWIDGKYDGVKVGKCKWYNHLKRNGDNIKLQGTWEVAYARFLDDSFIIYEAHKGRIKYKDKNGIERSYYPDFYLNESNEYIDIKGVIYDVDKLKNVMLSNPEIRLKIIDKEALCSLGINYKKVQNELLSLK